MATAHGTNNMASLNIAITSAMSCVCEGLKLADGVFNCKPALAAMPESIMTRRAPRHDGLHSQEQQNLAQCCSREAAPCCQR